MPGWFEENGYVPSNGNTGIGGYGRGTVPPVVADAPAADYSTAGQYAPGHGHGYDPDKIADPTRGDSAKYQMARVLSQFNPKDGYTPEVLKALNSLNIGTFTAKDDKLKVGGNVSPQFGRTRAFDAIEHFTDSDTSKRTWSYLQQDKIGEGPGAHPMPASGPGGGINDAFGGQGGYGGGGGYASASSGQPQGLSLNGPIDPLKYEEFHAPDPFKAPTAAEVQNDPGYAFGRDEGLKAMQASAAAKGILRGTGTLQGLDRYANDYASTKYNDVVNRNLAVYNRNYDSAFQTNQANNGGRLGAFNANTNAALGFGNLDLGYGNLGLGYTRAGNDFSLGQGQLALGNKQADQGYAINRGNLGLGWANYGLNADQQNFNQGYSLADMGLRAATTYGNAGQNYANAAGNNATGAGNALAAGRVGSANAWNQGLTGAVNAGMGAYGMYQYGQGVAPHGPAPGGTISGGYTGPGAQYYNQYNG